MLLHQSAQRYAMSVPSLLKSQQNSTLCVNFEDHGEALELSIYIDIYDKNITVFNGPIPSTNSYTCHHFKVPEVKKAASVFITLEAVGQTVTFMDRQSVVIDVPVNIVLIQMDKPKYRGGQTVQFRIFSLNSELHPVTETYSVVYVLSPLGSRMYQWENPDSVSGIVSLAFTLESDAVPGYYQIQAEKASEGSATQQFMVEDYNLPKFSVQLVAPQIITVLDKTLSFAVTATYTYGQGVPGNLTGRICKGASTYYGAGCNVDPDGLCFPITGKLDSTGTYNGSVDLTRFQMDLSGNGLSFILQITLTEEGTAFQVTESQPVTVSRPKVQMLFDNKAMKGYYKRDIPYLVRVMMKNEQGQPMNNETVELQVSGTTVQNLTTDGNGQAEYEIDTSGMSQSQIQLQALYKQPNICTFNHWINPTFSNAYYTVNRFYSRTRSYVDLQGPAGDLACGQTYGVRVRYVLGKEATRDGVSIVRFYYQIMAKAQIQQYGEHQVDLSNSRKGEFYLNFTVTANHAPSLDFTVYSLVENEVIADTVHLLTDKCFKDQVSLSFSPDKGTPGSSVQLNLAAGMRGICAMRVIDSSVSLLSQYEEFTAEKIYNSLRYTSLNGYWWAGYNVAPPSPPCRDPNEELFYNGSFYKEVGYTEDVPISELSQVLIGTTRLYSVLISELSQVLIGTMCLNSLLISELSQVLIVPISELSQVVIGTMCLHSLLISELSQVLIGTMCLYSVLISELSQVLIGTTCLHSLLISELSQVLIGTMCLHSLLISELSQGIGLVFATNSSLKKPELCGSRFTPYYMETESYSRRIASATVLPMYTFKEVSPVTTVRTKFPEVWKFNLIPISESGLASETETVPDTITSWEGSMFCVSPNGFGMTNKATEFIVFQPFFVELTLPNSIIRGEKLELRAVVLNHMDKDIKIRGTLAQSDKFTAILQEGQQDMCVRSRQRGVFIWELTPVSLGVMEVNVTAETTHIGASCTGSPDQTQPPRKDTVMQSAIVEAEGIEKELTHSRLVCVRDTESVIPINITPPKNTVPGSPVASITVMGDLLASAVNNPQSLIRLPMGCGEQILSILLPIPFIVQYLNNTGQLTDKIQKSSNDAMSRGYINMLKFQSADGGFSTFFGNSQSNSWLTANAVRALQEVSKHVFVDQTVTDRALSFLERSQDIRTGCFKPSGTVFNNALTGEVGSELAFTAHLTSILLKSSYIGRQTLLRSALTCLDTASKKQEIEIYDLSLLFYVFTAAGVEEKSQTMLNKLKELAVSQDGTLHWERRVKPVSERVSFFYPQSASGDIEITATVLLGLVNRPNPSAEDINYMNQIVLWLSWQQNALGGYRSTKDTVVTIEALSAYSTLTYIKNATNQVQVSQENALVAQFNVNNTNRLAPQKASLPTVPGNYSIRVAGRGCTLVKTTVRYHVPVPKENSAFSLSVNSSSESCVNGVAYNFIISITASYRGLRNQSNMAIIDLKLPSGYSRDFQLSELRNLVSKIETTGNHVIIYLDTVTTEPISLSLRVQMTSRVFNFQPTYVYMYDYYESDDNGLAMLYHPCAKQ
ncbi:alpha-2-macroglobulin-like [Bombina bombina]|uniref:alpha-2-macroglobulin-like n=1 Tax=Bombina bombina TaxID=8345 RepID=UPI00235A5A44|nr:alpha-2-macroglobulin-like [Bombina bombina]